MTLADCCVHGKRRTTEVMVEVERGVFRCKSPDQCKGMARPDPTMCCVHKKRRATEFMEEWEGGAFRCKAGEECKGGYRREDGREERDPRDTRDTRDTRDRDGRDAKRRRVDEPRGGFAYPQLSEEQRAYLYQEGMRMVAMATGTIPPAQPGYFPMPGLPERHHPSSRGEERRLVVHGGHRTQVCSLHNKPRSMDWLEEVSGGKFRCHRDSPCILGRTETH
eukprot:NODE_4626_length_762_cov_19.089764_g4467_i0.p2 GENE.NODE_4626_length_762_cov_19.089764_g4467_i0~~NODE_4626_length_762_cov_19.089764_g4467_i0.p2  ORF type:complete len:221 (+),score=40.18 NODE_4626_length_762_cov_19.089764_g4467_i0:58-720(+)